MYIYICIRIDIYIYIYIYIMSKHHDYMTEFYMSLRAWNPFNTNLRLGGSDAHADHSAELLSQALGRIKQLEMQLQVSGGSSEPSPLRRSQCMTPASLTADGGSPKEAAAATEAWLQSCWVVDVFKVSFRYRNTSVYIYIYDMGVYIYIYIYNNAADHV